MNIFKASQEGIQERSTSYLNMPYLGSATIDSVELKEINKTEDCFVVSFTVHDTDVRGNSVRGYNHERVEWAPDENTDKEKVKKAVDRVAYFVTKFFPEEKQSEILSIEGDSWRDYCLKMIQYLNNTTYIGKQVSIKVVGSVYEGKPSISTPKYPGWIYTDDQLPSFSKKEMISNSEYIAALSSAPTNTDVVNSELDNIDESVF